MRLSVKKAAYADVSRVAYRKSGVVLGTIPKGRPSPARDG
jgi:hypothetical protein